MEGKPKSTSLSCSKHKLMLSDLIPLHISLISCRLSSWRLVLIIITATKRLCMLIPWWGLYRAQDRAEPSQVSHPGPTPEKRQGTWCRWWHNWKQGGITLSINEGLPTHLSIKHKHHWTPHTQPWGILDTEERMQSRRWRRTQPKTRDIQIKMQTLQIKIKIAALISESSAIWYNDSHLRVTCMVEMIMPRCMTNWPRAAERL